MPGVAVGRIFGEREADGRFRDILCEVELRGPRSKVRAPGDGIPPRSGDTAQLARLTMVDQPGRSFMSTALLLEEVAARPVVSVKRASVAGGCVVSLSGFRIR